MNKTLILRADDLGSSHSANYAIVQSVKNKLIKNVSIMAVGPEIDEAAILLANNNDICFGMHATINAEWDKVKWKPLSTLTLDSGLVDEQGFFLNDPSLFTQTKPKISDILNELDNQLEYLVHKGFKIRYVDTHMLPEAKVDGLDEALQKWIKEKGLIDHSYYYGNPVMIPMTDLITLIKTLVKFKEDQYFMVVHPSLDSKEMRLTGNAFISGEIVAQMRQKETDVMSHKLLPLIFKILRIKTIRYDQAIPKERIDFKKF
jgi:hypothetical protein